MSTRASRYPLLNTAFDLATEYLDGLSQRPVGARATLEEVRKDLDHPLLEEEIDQRQVIEELARDVERGLVASAGSRYFGYVMGGALPVAVATDWLVSAWDQNSALYSQSPAASVVEEIVIRWILDLVGLPAAASGALVTGCQMANFTCLAAARHEVLHRAGWAVEENGLIGAPPVNLIVGAEAHVTILKALRMLGLGDANVLRIPADDQSRMKVDEFEKTLKKVKGPTIICVQAGNVNTGAFDRMPEINALAHAREAWVHVDGAFGLWAAASSRQRELTAGLADADSWATDSHKWLNVPFDSGVALIADAHAHHEALTLHASYLMQSGGPERDGLEWAPEASRRARGFVLYATLRSLGRRGVADLVDRCIRLAQRVASKLAAAPGARVLNDVVLNQVLVSFEAPPGADPDEYTRSIVRRIQREGTCWIGTTRWEGREAVRISVSGWSTTEADIDRSADAILRMVTEEAQDRKAPLTAVF